MIDVLEQNNKKEVVVRFILTLTKTQMNNIPLYEKVKYYMNSYEKDSFVLCVDSLAKDIAKYHSELCRYRYTWMNYLQKNYEKKLKKIQRKLEEAVSQ